MPRTYSKQVKRDAPCDGGRWDRSTPGPCRYGTSRSELQLWVQNDRLEACVCLRVIRRWRRFLF